jgi:hypothetical protein
VVYPFRKIERLAGEDPAGWNVRAVVSFIYHLFPNTLIAVEPYHVSIITVVPIDERTAAIRSTVLASKPRLLQRDNLLKDVALLRAGLVEDYTIGESIQAGFASGANDRFAFGRYEGALARFHQAIDERLA